MLKDKDKIGVELLKFGRFNDHQHPPLMAMVEITNRCNMACPICFTSASATAVDVSLAEIRIRIDNLVEIAGPIPIQISGGEPTLHPELPAVIAYARSLGFKNIELVTNGIRLSREPEYLFPLVDRGLSAVYLQFDGLNRDTFITLRGRDMSEVRAKSIAAIRKARICCTLAVAVTRGVNDTEIGDIVRFGIENIDTVRAINFQSAARFAGRFEIDNKQAGYDIPGLTRLIEQQSDLPPGGFRTDILGHSNCNAMSLVYVIDGELRPLFKYLSRESLLKFLGRDKRRVILDLFMGKERFARTYWRDPKAWQVLIEAASIFGRNPNLQAILKSKHLLLFAKSFMEKNQLNPQRVNECNYGIATTDGVYSFCAYNNLYRFADEQVNHEKI
jgi:uncharacterized radical SAM superfamily Fe-S cluster-containing enzyme